LYILELYIVFSWFKWKKMLTQNFKKITHKLTFVVHATSIN